MAGKNGANGKGVSRRVLPKTREIDLREDAAPPARRRSPRLKPGDRVTGIGGSPCGIVRSVRRGEAQVHWGTADNREVVSWTPTSELEKATERVSTAEEVNRRQATQTGMPWRIEEE